MPYTPIIGTLGFIISEDKEKVLLIHRIGRENDQHYGKYNGLGGKMESGEDVLTCIRREIHEEAGIGCESIYLKGTVNWTGFGPCGEDWLGFIFLIEKFSGTPKTFNEEGRLEWVPIKDISSLPMWEGDRLFLPLIFDGERTPFHGHMPYNGETVTNWSYHLEN